jgi:prepilin-type N-terminal cleavage/methylation domain-containing protein
MLVHRHKNKLSDRGDTLIEVLFAVAVFSLVAVGALSIMNQGTASAERSLEITLVRQQIDAQAETLRYLNAAFIAGAAVGTTEWQKIQAVSNNNLQANDYNSSSCEVPDSNKVFVLNTHKAQFDDAHPGLATTFSQVRYIGDTVDAAEGIWIQPVKSITADGTGYIDFHIRACWDSPGQSFPVSIGTIVRLYEPRS